MVGEGNVFAGIMDPVEDAYKIDESRRVLLDYRVLEATGEGLTCRTHQVLDQ